MTTTYTVSPLLPAALERLGKNAAALRRAIEALPRGDIPTDPRAQAPLLVAAEDVLVEARAIVAPLEDIAAKLRQR